MTRRPTLLDVARCAGTSKTVASYALNGTGRVSAATRSKVLAAAEALGWQPNTAAPFLVHFMTGAERKLSGHDYMLLLHYVADHTAACETYRRWWGERRVDGVLMLDLIVDDPRIDVAEELHLPAVVLGGPAMSGSVRSLTSGVAGKLGAVVDYLAASGHRSLAWVGGDQQYQQTQLRESILREAAARRGMDFHVRLNDSSREQGTRATRDVLSLPEAPTALLFNNDVMAAAALGVTREMGIRVPEEVSIIAGEDTELCNLVHPQLTALSRDIPTVGTLAATALLDIIAGEPAESYMLPAPELKVRASTRPPLRAAVAAR